MFAWIGKVIGWALSPAGGEVIDEVTTEAKEYLQKLQDDTRPMPMSAKAVALRNAQIAEGARAFPAGPPTCPPSLPPSAPPVSYHSPPPTPRPMPLDRSLGSGPPPRLSPPPELPIPPPRPKRRHQP